MRAKLVWTSLIPLIVLLPIVMSVMFFLGDGAYNSILGSKLRSDLSIASQYFERLQVEHQLSLKSIANSEKLAQQLRRASPQAIDQFLKERMQREGYSYLVFRPFKDPAVYQQDSDIVAAKALQAGSASGLSIMSQSLMASLDPDLPRAARLDIVYTPNASPDERREESRGLMLQSASQVLMNGQVVGVLEAGTLLNRNLDIVNRVSELVYPQDSLLRGSLGTATLFLGDVRIATTVRSVSGDVALGTRVSSMVHDRVLGRGDVWLEKAFVVSDWYMSGYMPLNNLAGYRVGMLYVGFLETPYRHLRENILWGLVIGGVIAAVIGVWLVFSLAAGIFDPLLRMNDTMSRVEAGDDKARVGDLRRMDEFAQLADHFDALLDQLESRQDELLQLNRDLDQRVSARTADLLEANQMLQRAQQQLLSSEKLATMGQLTAGLAHEINNPLAVMQGHLDLMTHTLVSEPVYPQIKPEIKLLDEQIQRMRLLVEKLLQFARPDSYVGYTESVDSNQVIQDSMVLVEREIKTSGASVDFQLHATRPVQVSPTELQQVVVNILINAAHAVSLNAAGIKPAIMIETTDVQVEDEPGVQIVISNTGPAIDQDKQALIFELFYTTKRQSGTGLGLPVSRMLMERYGGTLAVKSPLHESPTAQEPVSGCQFIVTLRCSARYSSDMIRAAIFKTQQTGAQTLEPEPNV